MTGVSKRIGPEGSSYRPGSPWVGCEVTLNILPTEFAVGSGGGLNQYHAFAAVRAGSVGILFEFPGVCTYSAPQQKHKPLWC